MYVLYLNLNYKEDNSRELQLFLLLYNDNNNNNNLEIVDLTENTYLLLLYSNKILYKVLLIV